MEKTLEQANAELLERQAKLRAGRAKDAPQDLTVNIPKTSSFNGLSDEEVAADRKRQDEEHARKQAFEAAEGLRRRLARAKIPARHLATVPNPSESWTAASASVGAKLGRGSLIALLGIRGAGKTQIAVEAIRSCVESGREARYVKALDLIIRFREAFRKDGPTERTVLDEFAIPDLLVIDALEERGETDFEDRMIHHLVDLRYDACLDTILVSNQTKEAFQKSVGASAVSRIHETGDVIECTWESFRKKPVESRNALPVGDR